MNRKLRAILGVKGFLCLVSLIMVVLALVTYTAVITITPTKQFNIGATTASTRSMAAQKSLVRWLMVIPSTLPCLLSKTLKP